MATYDFTFYDATPAASGFPGGTGSFTYTGPSDQDGVGQITDNAGGLDGQTFTDNDGVTGTFTVGGNTSTNVSTEPDGGWVIRDLVTLEEFRVVGLLVTSGPAVGTYMISEVPLVPGRNYQALSYEDDPSESGTGARYAEFVCYGPATLILTPDRGEVPVEDLRVGDKVETLDAGAQPLRWIGRRTLVFSELNARQRPIEIKQGAFGDGAPHTSLVVSPQHCLLMQSGTDERLVPARGRLSRPRIREKRGARRIDYFSLLCSRHQVIRANGVWSETLHPGPYAISTFSVSQRAQLHGLHPRLMVDPRGGYGPTARPRLSVSAARQSRLSPSVPAGVP